MHSFPMTFDLLFNNNKDSFNWKTVWISYYQKIGYAYDNMFLIDIHQSLAILQI